MKYLHLILAVIIATPISLMAATEQNNLGDLSLKNVVQITLDTSPNIKLQRLGVDLAKAQERIEKGAFNLTTFASLTALNKLTTKMVPEDLEAKPYANPDVIEEAKTGLKPFDKYNDRDIQSFKTGVEKAFRTGIQSRLQLRMVREDFLQGDALFDPNGIKNPTENKTDVVLEVNIPLLKGRGKVSAAGDETAARLKRKASQADYEFAITRQILATIRAYWNYGVSFEVLKLQQRSASRVQNWLEQRGGDDDNLQGYLEQKRGDISDAEQSTTQARIALANAMGIPSAEADRLGMPSATDNFPLDWAPILETFNLEQARRKWLETAQANRLDLRAAKLRLESARTLVAKARRDRLPQVDIGVSVGYQGLDYYDGFGNYVDSIHRNVRGLDYRVGINYRYPLGNDTARGILDLRQVSRQKNQVEYNEAQRSVDLAVSNETANVNGRLNKVVQTRKTADSYLQSIIKIQKSEGYLSSTTKVLTLIELETNLVEALNDYYAALGDLANAIAKIRFETGTLLDVQKGPAGNLTGRIDLRSLTHL